MKPDESGLSAVEASEGIDDARERQPRRPDQHRPPSRPLSRFPRAQPHDDSAYPRAVGTFLALEGVSKASKRKILWETCARLYGI